MFDDIEFLVSETFNGRPDFIERTEARIPNAPGLIFHLQISGDTFVVRSLATENMQSEYDQIIENDLKREKLRVDSDQIDQICYFETDNLAIAQIIQKQIANRRLPIHEERVCNISDPGFSWWMKDEGESISILFNLSHTDQMSELIKLGPIGDCSVANKKFQKMYTFFNTLFPVKSFSSGRNRFNFSVDDSNKGYFAHLKQAFIHGEFSLNLASYIEEVEANLNDSKKIEFQSNYLFLKELIETRKFFLKLESIIRDRQF